MSIFNGTQNCHSSDVGNNQVVLGSATSLDAFGRLRVSQPYTLFDSHQHYQLDKSFSSNVANNGTITYMQQMSACNLMCSNVLGSFAARETKYVFTYQPGKSLLVMATFVMAPQSDGLVQRVGYFDVNDGIYVELSDQLYMVRRSNSLGTVTNTTVAQSAWNTDHLDGFGPSGITIDMTKSHIFWTDIEWLGVGSVRTGFVIDGRYIICHVFNHANFLNYPYMTSAINPVRYEIRNTTGAAPVSNLMQVCSTVISEGGYDQQYSLHSNIAYFSRTMTVGVWYPLMSIKLSDGFLDAVVQIRQIEVVCTTNDTFQWALWSNVTSGNIGNPVFIPHISSAQIQFNGNANSFTTTTCDQFASGIVTGTNQASGGSVIELSKYFSQIGRNSFTGTSDIITLAVMNIKPGGSAVNIQALLSWNELF